MAAQQPPPVIREKTVPKTRQNAPVDLDEIHGGFGAIRAYEKMLIAVLYCYPIKSLVSLPGAKPRNCRLFEASIKPR